MTEFKFSYAPSKLEVTDLMPLFDLCRQYQKIGMGMENFVNNNSICNLFSNERMTFDDLRTRLSNTSILDYISPYIIQAEDFGIKSFSNFSCWIQGNNTNLPNGPTYKLDAHTHPFRLPHDTSPAYTYTIVSSLSVSDTVNEKFWAKWIDDSKNTITTDWKLLESKSTEIVNSFYRSEKIAANSVKHWNKMRTEFPGEEMIAYLPKQGEQLIVNFNSKNWLHGIDNISDNLYLYILFDDYTL